MDLKSYIQLKEAYVNLNAPKVEVTQEEVEAFALRLVEEEGLDLSDMTWDQLREAYMDESRVFGQVSRAAQKMFGNAQQKNDAVSYEKSYNDINKRRGQGVGDKKTVTKGEIDAETAGRRKADPKYKPGQGVGSGQKLTVKPTNNKPPVKTDPAKKVDPAGGGNGGGNNSPAPAPAKVAPKPAAQTGDKKADMASWAKANPKLAAAKKQRDTTRGTSATTNPLMKDLAKRMPKPVAPAKTTPTPAKSLTGNTAAKSMSPGGAKAVAPAATKAPKLKVESVDVFDTILAHLIEQGFGNDEALILMTSMSEEKRQQMLALISEEGADARKDKQLENGGHASRSDYNRPTRNPATGDKKKGETPLQKAAKEKYGAGASAMDIVKAKIKAQHGDKAIKDTKKD